MHKVSPPQPSFHFRRHFMPLSHSSHYPNTPLFQETIFLLVSFFLYFRVRVQHRAYMCTSAGEYKGLESKVIFECLVHNALFPLVVNECSGLWEVVSKGKSHWRLNSPASSTDGTRTSMHCRIRRQFSCIRWQARFALSLVAYFTLLDNVTPFAGRATAHVHIWLWFISEVIQDPTWLDAFFVC